MRHFSAPWGWPLRILTLLATLVCFGVPIYRTHFFTHVPHDFRWISMCIVLPLALWFVAALFVVRGYIVTPDAVLIQRLFWSTRLSTSDLESARYQPDAFHCFTLRTFGNGGFFAFTGFYRNRILGSFRAFVTDRSKPVVLRYPRRIVVISPDQPQAFVEALSNASS